MANLKFTNFAVSTIADVGGIAAGDLTVNVAAGHGALFPALAAGEYFYCVLVDSSANREIVKVTARSTDAFTIVRAQDNTSARAFSQGDKIELRLTAVQIEEIQTASERDELWDDDSDTGIQVEEGADDDTIRFDAAGAEKVTIDSSGLHAPAYDIDRARYAADAEASDTYVVTLSPAPSAYAAGMMVTFKANTINTGACTINVNTLGAKSIKKRVDQDPATGDIKAGQIVTIVYDGTNFQMVNDPGEPVGSIVALPIGTAPSGYVECDGSAISRSTYAALFAVISDDYGNGDGATTFNLPDYRGRFLRGWDNSAGTDPNAGTRTDRGDGTAGDNVGTKQADEYKAHTHTGAVNTAAGEDSGGNVYYKGSSAAIATGSSGGSETRPKNINVMYCIKY